MDGLSLMDNIKTMSISEVGAAPSRFVHNVTHLPDMCRKGENQEALTQFNTDFPNGYAIVQTSGKGLLCGINALAISLGHIFKIPAAQVTKELMQLLEHKEYKAMCKTASFTNDNNFYVDQLAFLTYLFGADRGIELLSLGYLLGDGRCQRYPGPASTRWVWLQSSSLTGMTPEFGMDHYEGIVTSLLPVTNKLANTEGNNAGGVEVKIKLANTEGNNAGGVEVKTAPVDENTTEEAPVLKEEHEEPVQQESIMPINGQTNATAVYEPVPSSTTCFTFNNKFYGISTDALLQPVVHGSEKSPQYMMKAYTREPNLRGLISVRGEIDRDPKAADNPTHQPRYCFWLETNLMDVVEFVYVKPGQWAVTSDFPDASKFGLLTVNSRSVRLSNGTVPTLLDSAAEARLRTQNEAIASNTGHFKFQFLVRYEEFNGVDILSQVLQYKWEQDTKVDQMAAWVKNSPIKKQLGFGNIFSPVDRPGLSQNNLVLALRRTHADDLEFKVFAVYSLYIEYQYAQSAIDVLFGENIATTITDVMASAFATNEFDNLLPKLYRLSARWPTDADKPRPGDKFEVSFAEFPTGDCTKWTGPPIKHTKLFYDDFLEGDEIITGMTAEDKEDKADEQNEEHRLSRRSIWTVYFWGEDELTVPGEVTLWAERPSDTMWEGPRDVSPTVPTEVPTHEQRFHSNKRYIEVVKSHAHRHQLHFLKISSDQTFKDMVRCIDELSQTAEQDLGNDNASQHLLKLFISGDLQRNPFRVRNILNATDSSTFTALTARLTDYQRQRLTQTLSRVEHGVALIKGCPAAAKTVMLEISALLLTTHKLGTPQMLFVTDVNSGVNDIASRLSKRAAAAGMTGITIIRVHSLDGEISRFINKYIDSQGSRPRFERNESLQVKVPSGINDIASTHDQNKQDKRYDQDIVNLDLNAAIDNFFRTNHLDSDVAALRSYISDFKGNADVSVMSQIKAAVTRIIEKVFRTATIVVTTCALAVQNGISSRFQPQFIFKDEDCRSVPQYFYAIAGAYLGSVDTFFLAGDPIQKIPFQITAADSNDTNAFTRELSYTAFQRLDDMGIRCYPFYEQHRMHSRILVKYISEHHYVDAMADGTLLRPQPPHVEFMRRFHQDQYGVDSNIMVILTTDTQSRRVEGGTSLYNDAHAVICTEYVKALSTALIKHDIPFKATDLGVLYLSSYLAQVANVHKRFKNMVSPLSLESKTIEVSQGLQRGIVIRDVLNSKLTAMAGNKRDCLVADTRFQYGYVYIVTSECLQYEAYSFAFANRMFNDPRTRHVYGIYHLAKTHGWIHEMAAPTTKTCNICDEAGHLASNCKDRGSCHNCGSTEHRVANCDAGFLIEIEPKDKDGKPPKPKACKRCQSLDHTVADCLVCRACKVAGHEYLNCPEATCKKCNVTGHWTADPACPKYTTCKKCGGNHRVSKCEHKPTKQFALQNPEVKEITAMQNIFALMDENAVIAAYQVGVDEKTAEEVAGGWGDGGTGDQNAGAAVEKWNDGTGDQNAGAAVEKWNDGTGDQNAGAAVEKWNDGTGDQNAGAVEKWNDGTGDQNAGAVEKWNDGTGDQNAGAVEKWNDGTGDQNTGASW